jgi:hypothetical protein
MTISRWILLRMRNVSYKIIEKIKTHILSSVNFFPRKPCPLWDNIEKYGRVRDRKWQYGAAFDSGLVRIHARKQTSTPYIHKCSRTARFSEPQCYVIRTLPVFSIFPAFVRVAQANSSLGRCCSCTPGVIRKDCGFVYSYESAVSQSVIDVATGLGAGWTGVRIPFVGGVHFQTGFWAHPGCS